MLSFYYKSSNISLLSVKKQIKEGIPGMVSFYYDFFFLTNPNTIFYSMMSYYSFMKWSQTINSPKYGKNFPFWESTKRKILDASVGRLPTLHEGWSRQVLGRPHHSPSYRIHKDLCRILKDQGCSFWSL